MEVSKQYNRKKVNKIKKMILLTVIMLFIFPIIICMFLMAKLSDMEKRMDELSVKIDSANSVTTKDVTLQNDNLELDVAAYEEIEKQDASYNLLTMSDEDLLEKESLNGEIEKETKKVYLTFDDGPSIYTDDILEILDKNDVKATFFVVYYKEPYMWDEYKKIVDGGHTLGMHSYLHEYDSVYADIESFEKDVDTIHDFLYDQTGVDCKYYRFPGGSSNTVSSVDMNECFNYLVEKGYEYYDWNAVSNDAVDHDLTSDELVDNIMGYVRSNPGDSIVLMHDLSTTHETVVGLQLLIDTLRSEGYEICPIDENTVPIHHREKE